MTQLPWTPAVSAGDRPLQEALPRPKPLGPSITSGSRTEEFALRAYPGRADGPEWETFKEIAVWDTLIEFVLRIRWHLSAPAFTRTFGLRSAGRGDSEAEQRAIKNRRRVFLIDKDLAGQLTPTERAELSELEADLERFTSAVAPLPFAALEELEQQVSRLGPPPAGP